MGTVDPKKVVLMVVGEGSVGKSCCTIRMVHERFIEEYDPTIDDEYKLSATVDGDPLYLTIMDTSGQEELVAVRQGTYLHADGFLVMFSVAAPSTFRGVQLFLEEILHSRDQDLQLESAGDEEQHKAGSVCPMVLVGNKSDLRRGRGPLEEVPKEEAEELARKLGCPYLETSALTGEHVQEAFHEGVRRVRACRELAAHGRPGFRGDKKNKGKRRMCTLL